MKKVLFATFLLSIVILIHGCAVAPVIPPRGILYSNQKAPMFGGRVAGTISGEATCHNVLFLFGWGDCSISAAAADGNINVIRHVDYQLVNYFLFYQGFTTIVYGESGAEAITSKKAE
jgi:hypothetical protein